MLGQMIRPCCPKFDTPTVFHEVQQRRVDKMLTVTLVSALMTNDAVAQPDSLESVLHGDVIMNVGV